MQRVEGQCHFLFTICFSSANSKLYSSTTMVTLFSNKIARDELKPGDHIYSWRHSYLYAHHGIYVGNGNVIHFTRGPGQETGTGTVLDKILVSSSPSNPWDSPCPRCGDQSKDDGVISSCLECFLSGGELYQFQYGVTKAVFLAKARGGTCTLAHSDPPEHVLHRAKYLLQIGFGGYNIFTNNCEDFALYCKTGLLIVTDVGVGRSGQATSFAAAVGAIAASPLQYLTGFGGLTAVGFGFYCTSRIAFDIGVRRDVEKIPVETLVVEAEAGRLLTGPGVDAGRLLTGPSVDAGRRLLIGPSVDAGRLLTGPSVDAGRRLLTGPSVDSGMLLTGPSVDAGRLLTGPSIDAGMLLTGPSVDAGRRLLTSPSVDAGRRLLTSPSVDAGRLLTGPSVDAGRRLLTGPSVDAGRLLTGPSVDAGRRLLTGPSVDAGRLLTGPSVDAGRLLTGPSVDAGRRLLTGPSVDSGMLLTGPSVDAGRRLLTGPSVDNGRLLTGPSVAKNHKEN